MSAKNDDFEIFISYASPDIDQARQIYRPMRHRGRVFFAEECLQPGDDWRTRINEALFEALVIVVLLTRNSRYALYQTGECSAALGRWRENKEGVRIVPVFGNDEAIKFFHEFSAFKPLDLRTTSYEDIANHVSSQLEALRPAKDTPETPAPADARMTDKREASFAKVGRYLDLNMVFPAVDRLLDGWEFADVPPEDKLQIIRIYQKFGWINLADSQISSLGHQRFEWPEELEAQLRLVELKLASQRGDFWWVIAHHASVDKALIRTGFPLRRISAFHRLGVAHAVKGDSEKSEAAFAQALGLSSENKQVHAKWTGKMLRALARAFRTRPAERGQRDLTRELIVTLREVQSQYLSAPVDRSLDQANRRKAFVSSIFAEAAVLLRCSDTRDAGWYVLGLAYLLNQSAATHATAEGYAELLRLVDEEWLKSLVNCALRPELEAEGAFSVEFARKYPDQLPEFQDDIEKKLNVLDIESWKAFRPYFDRRLDSLGAP